MCKVMVVDDARTVRSALLRMLRKLGLDPVEAESGEQALGLLAIEQPELVLLDVSMPGMGGYELARRIRQRTADAWLPIIFLSGNSEDADLQLGIEAGGDDYLSKPVSEVVLAAKIQALRRIDAMRRKLVDVTRELAAANDKLARLSEQDSLTGLANRRHFDSTLESECARVNRGGQPMALLMIDVDHFKLFNDSYGHPAGDRCLRKVAAAIGSMCRRPNDLVARYGGEEFAVILPATTAQGAAVIAESIRTAVASEGIAHCQSSTGGTITVSVGFSTVQAGMPATAVELLSRADESLYRAKALGRNRWHSFDVPGPGLGLGAPQFPVAA